MESTLRVELEGSGIIGFISVTNDTMLVEARALIDDELDDVPPSYIFLLDGSVPLGHKQEKKKTCQQFLPTIVIRPTSSAAPAAAAAPAASPFAAAAPVAAAAPAAPSASDLNREKLMRFYKKYNPGKVDTVDAILRRFQGEEDAMFQKLYTKYNLDARGQPLNSAALKQKVRDDKKKAVKEAALIKAGKETGHSYMDDPEEAVYPSVMQGVKDIYRQMIAPVEKMYLFDQFYSPILQDSDFDAKPMLLMLGQYSTGKTTFIQYLLERDFPGIRIGPEPTTDRFVAIMHGEEERTTPGHAVAIQADKPFTALNRFGSSFLSKFEVAELDSPILRKMTIVDTPGVLAGAKQRIGRSYDFPTIIEWFAAKADRILLLFDAHKLDISDEFKAAIMMLKGHDDKIRCVLNKADKVNQSSLMRVYGALMWSLGKVIQTPEVLRVYIGSFWDQPYQHTDMAKLFEKEEADLFTDLRSVPRNAVVRKINELLKRVRLCKVHAYLIGYIRGQMPRMMGKEKKQNQLLAQIADGSLFWEVQRRYTLNQGDFPQIAKFARKAETYKFWKDFQPLDLSKLKKLDEVLAQKLPILMRQLPITSTEHDEESAASADTAYNPFAESGPRGGGATWRIDGVMKARYRDAFVGLPGGRRGKVKGGDAVPHFKKSGLNQTQLGAIWALSDIDKDGALDMDEFCVASYLCEEVAGGAPIPESLTADIIPPSKRS